MSERGRGRVFRPTYRDRRMGQLKTSAVWWISFPVGHKTQSIYSRYAIADESMLQDGGTRLSTLHAKEAEGARVVVPITEARSASGKVGTKSRG